MLFASNRSLLVGLDRVNREIHRLTRGRCERRAGGAKTVPDGAESQQAWKRRRVVFRGGKRQRRRSSYLKLSSLLASCVFPQTRTMLGFHSDEKVHIVLVRNVLVPIRNVFSPGVRSL